MESLVYENSPLADYLQGLCYSSQYSLVARLTYFVTGEGEPEESWPVGDTHTEDEGDHPSSDFAPRGASRFQERVRNKLPKPLDLRNTRQGAVVGKLYGACSVC